MSVTIPWYVSTEFVKPAPDLVRSAKGFTVAFHPPGGVDYSDDVCGKIHVGTELYHDPVRHVIFRNSRDLKAMPRSRATEILDNVKRAMEFLGRPAEIHQE